MYMRPRTAVSVLVVLLACGGCTRHVVATGPGDSAKVVAARGATVKLRGVTLDIPPGALSADTTVTASHTGVPAPPPGAARPAGDPVLVDVGSAHLVKPLTLTLPLRAR